MKKRSTLLILCIFGCNSPANDGGLLPLSAIPVPADGDAIRDRAAAIRLGKAFFWDSQVGSDGRTACASCHFAAGADTTDLSLGVPKASFLALDENEVDRCEPPAVGERQKTKRHSPSAIGALFFFEQLWDGREASLASQALGPANDPIEMACEGRDWHGENGLGAKLLAKQPLALQEISIRDGVLGTLAREGRRGLYCGDPPCSYAVLIAAAFGDTSLDFRTVWGQAIQAYEATLIPDQTPFDHYLAGDALAITPQQLQGFEEFLDECSACHAGSELSDATFSFRAANGAINDDGGDQGFHNLGVRPTEEDLGRGGSNKEGHVFSISKSASDRGAFKTPSLRNVKLTAPYFHNGGKKTLSEVVDFYDDGGDFENAEQADEIDDIDVGEKAALLDFLENALTDCRVEKKRAPFDHPSLLLADGTTLPAVGGEGEGDCP